MQNAPRLGLHREIPVRELFFAQNRERILDQKSRRIEHDQDFGDERFDRGLPCFLRDAPRDVGLMREKNLPEAAQYPHAIADTPGVPVRLCGARASHGGTHFRWTGTVQFAKYFSSRRVYGSDA